MKSTVGKTDIRLVEIDESYGWSKDTLKSCGGKITSVYMYDAKQTTCCCEPTPCYYLIPLYCIPAKSFDEISNEVQDDFSEGESQNEPMYSKCSDIDRMQTVKAPKSLDGKFYAIEGKKYKEIMEYAEEYLKCNHQI